MKSKYCLYSLYSFLTHLAQLSASLYPIALPVFPSEFLPPHRKNRNLLLLNLYAELIVSTEQGRRLHLSTAASLGAANSAPLFVD